MKLIYIYIGGSKYSSVQQKVVNQIIELNSNGINAIGWFFTEEVQNDTNFNEFITLKPLRKYQKNHRFFHKNFEIQFHINQIHEALKLESFDRLFIRHISPGINYFKLLSKWSKKTYLYIPSNSVSENYNERRVNKSNSIFSWFLSWFQYFWFIWVMHNLLYLFILHKLKGVVAFTPEFAKMLKIKSFGRAKTIYNRDGADCKNIKKRNYTPNSNKYKLIFLKGSSMQQPWSGLDRLVKSIKARPDLDFELYITGSIYNKDDYNEPFIKLMGKLLNTDLEKLIDNVDIGVSNLANYMINFNETTNLKSRDYFARGLPFIQANTMPDVDGTIGENYYLNLPNNSSLIDLDLVIDFIEKMRNNKNHPDEMRKFAEEHLTWNITVGELSDILKSEFKN